MTDRQSGLSILWKEIPILFVACIGWSVMDLALNRFEQPAPGLLWATALPIVVASVALQIRYIRTGERRLQIGALAIPLLLLAPVVLIILLPHRPMEVREILLWFESMTVLAVLLLAVHCHLTRGAGKTWRLFGTGALYGLVLENGGVAMGFFAEEGYRLYLPLLPAPLATMAGWSTVWYCSTTVAEALTEPRGTLRRARPLLALSAALALDVGLDPVATRAAFWTWHESLSPAFLGVPLINYTAWVSGFFPFAVAWFWLEDRAWTESKKSIVLLLMLPLILICAAALVLTITLLLEGWDSPAMLLFREAF